MRSIFALLSVSTLFIFSTPQVLAAPPGGHLNIEEVAVTVDGSDTTIMISGTDFDFGEPLEVTLAGVPAEITSFSGTTITATVLTASYPAGDYLLNVSTGNGQSQNDEYDLTIGAVGPAGPAGADGADGADGANGADGAPGLPGADGADGLPGADGAPGADGSLGNPGVPGINGQNGLNCWDLNANGIFDVASEDVNADSVASATDCVGPQGAEGLPGQDGNDFRDEICALYVLTGSTAPLSLGCTAGGGMQGDSCGGFAGAMCAPDLQCVFVSPGDSAGVCQLPIGSSDGELLNVVFSGSITLADESTVFSGFRGGTVNGMIVMDLRCTTPSISGITSYILSEDPGCFSSWRVDLTSPAGEILTLQMSNFGLFIFPDGSPVGGGGGMVRIGGASPVSAGEAVFDVFFSQIFPDGTLMPSVNFMNTSELISRVQFSVSDLVGPVPLMVFTDFLAYTFTSSSP